MRKIRENKRRKERQSYKGKKREKQTFNKIIEILIFII